MDARIGYTAGGRRVLPALDLHGNPYRQSDIAATMYIGNGCFVVITQFRGDVEGLVNEARDSLKGESVDGNELPAPDENTE